MDGSVAYPPCVVAAFGVGRTTPSPNGRAPLIGQASSMIPVFAGPRTDVIAVTVRDFLRWPERDQHGVWTVPILSRW